MSDFDYSFNVLNFGDGTQVHVAEIEGLESLVIPLNDQPLPRNHGAIPGDSFMSKRVVILQLEVDGTDNADFATRLDAVLAAFGPQVTTELPFVFEHPGQAARRITCRPAKVDSRPTRVAKFQGLRQIVTVRLDAADPVVYADAQGSEDVPVFVSAAGLSYPVAYPKIYGSGGSGGGVTVTNAGNFETWPTLTIFGPSSSFLTDPVLQNVTTGKEIALTANGGAAVAVGQQLIVETHPLQRSINFSTGASRYGKLSVASEFWSLDPGDNEIRFRASGTTTNSFLRVEWRSAYLRG